MSSMPITNEELNSLSKDELVGRLLEAYDELDTLRGQLRASGCQPAEPLTPMRNYTLSASVLCIQGTDQHRICRGVPLHQILMRSAGRDDEREADTPVATQVGTDGAHPRFSVEMGRFSGFSAGSDEGGRLSLASLGHAGSPDFRLGQSPNGGQLSPAQFHAQSPQSQPRRRPDPISLPPRLEADAIMSAHTAHTFAQQMHRPMSPSQSRAAASLQQYLTDVFVRRDDFQHKLSTAQKEEFARSLLAVCGEVETIIRNEPRHVAVPSPCYVFGDIHGNFKDLHYFATQLLNFDDLRYVPYRMLFLGDYVDRGQHGVEVVAFLFALKVLAPHKVFLLRGNHEDTLVNGDVNLYRDTSFIHQCKQLFGPIYGEQVWERCNRVFSFLPLTANIDKKIFCTHGGLPRFSGGADDRMEMLMREDFPAFESFFKIPEGDTEFNAKCRQVASDVCWSDPAEEGQQTNEHGFGPNPRGNGVILFGSRAVDDFLAKYNYEYIFRAHQEKSDGLKISKNQRVMTIFSTSAYVGHQNGAGVVYVGDGRIRIVIKEAENK